MLIKILILSLTVQISSSAMAFAQSTRDVAVPAELPPASFGGAQYVDSKGCVFIRAGVNGNTVWVPRVTRSRKQVCDRSPTFSSVSAGGSAHILGTAPAVDIIIAPKPASPIAAPVVPVSDAPARIEPIRPIPVRAVAATAPIPPFAQPLATKPTGIPVGFRSAWDDGRLNPNRGARTAVGDAQMEMVWTNTVPRRLVPKP